MTTAALLVLLSIILVVGLLVTLPFYREEKIKKRGKR